MGLVAFLSSDLGTATPTGRVRHTIPDGTARSAERRMWVRREVGGGGARAPHMRIAGNASTRPSHDDRGERLDAPLT